MQNILEKIVSFLFLIVNFFLNIIANLTVSMIVPEEFMDVNMIANITNPQQVVWKSNDSVVFVTDGDIWEYTISEDSSKHIGKRESNDFVGIGDDGEILLCSIEHFTISSRDEFSTRFVIREMEREGSKENKESKKSEGIKESKQMEFFETIRPIYLDSKEIIAVTAVDFLEQYFYEIDIESGDMREIKEPRERVTPIYIPEEVEVKNIYFGEGKEYVIEDIFGNVYVSVRKDSPTLKNLKR